MEKATPACHTLDLCLDHVWQISSGVCSISGCVFLSLFSPGPNLLNCMACIPSQVPPFPGFFMVSGCPLTLTFSHSIHFHSYWTPLCLPLVSHIHKNNKTCFSWILKRSPVFDEAPDFCPVLFCGERIEC